MSSQKKTRKNNTTRFNSKNTPMNLSIESLRMRPRRLQAKARGYCAHHKEQISNSKSGKSQIQFKASNRIKFVAVRAAVAQREKANQHGNN